MQKIIDDAMMMAVNAHFGQRRRHNDIPYVTHCFEVMKRVSLYGITDHITLAAAMLHDVIEDTDLTERDLNVFDDRVVKIVKELSRPSNMKTKQEKYDFLLTYKQKLAESVIIKIADRYCNVMDFLNSGSIVYAAKYALQAYPLYQTFLKRELFHYSRIMEDISDLSILVERQFAISIFENGIENDVMKIVV